MLGSSEHVCVREARAADASALADVFRGSWTEAYTGIIPHLHLETLIRRRSEEWWSGAIRGGDSILVLEVGKATAGYATSGAARTRTAHQGEIYELYLAPVYQGLGFGELLFEGCRAGLDRRQLRGLVVWALSENSGATDFYWRRGGRPFARAYDRIGGARLEKIAFGWR